MTISKSGLWRLHCNVLIFMEMSAFKVMFKVKLSILLEEIVVKLRCLGLNDKKKAVF